MKSEHAACHNVYIHDDEQTGKIDEMRQAHDCGSVVELPINGD